MKPTRPCWVRAAVTIAAGLLLVKVLTGCAGPFALRVAGPEGSVEVGQSAKGGLVVGVEIRPEK